MEYKEVTYGKGFVLEVTPPDRSADVMHYLLTGHLLCGRSLEGVEWKEMDEDSEFVKLQRRRAAKLMKSMQKTKETIRDNAVNQLKDAELLRSKPDGWLDSEKPDPRGFFNSDDK